MNNVDSIGETEVIAITGSSKDIIASNLAAGLAKTESPDKILLIDLNLGCPQQHLFYDSVIVDTEKSKQKIIDENNEEKWEMPTLYHLLEYKKDLEGLIIKTKIPNLELILSEKDFRFHHKLEESQEAGEKIYEKFENGIKRIKLSKKYSKIIYPASFHTFASFSEIADKKYISAEPTTSSLTEAFYIIADSIAFNAKKNITKAVLGSLSLKEKERNLENLSKVLEVFSKNKSKIYNIRRFVERKIYDEQTQKIFLECIDTAEKNNKFGIIFDKIIKKSEVKGNYNMLISKEMAENRLLPDNVEIFCLGYLDYGKGKEFFGTYQALKEAENHGSPLILYEYEKEKNYNIFQKKFKKKLRIVESFEDICRYISQSNGKSAYEPKGFIRPRKIGELMKK